MGKLLLYIAILVVILVAFTGCMSIKDIKPEKIYSDIKVVYKDVKYVVYEIEEEKQRISEEGFGEK